MVIMQQSKKYSFQLVQSDATWSAEIVRRVTAKTNVVSKTQDGFATELEAQEWAKKEVKAFLDKSNATESSKRKANK